MGSFNKHRVLIILFITITIFAFSFFCLINKVYTIYQYFFLFPIVVSCFWFKKKGIIFSVGISVAQIFLYSFFTKENLEDEVAKLIVVVGLSIFVELLAEKILQKNADITRLNRQLHKYLEMMKKSEELSNMGSWRMDLKTNQMIWSDNLYKIFGMAPGKTEPSLEDRLRITHPEDLKLVDDTIINSLINRQSTKIESRIIRPDGSICWLLSIGYTEYDENGKPETLISSFLDITERKTYEQELYKEKERFKITLSSIGDGVISTDIKGNVTLLNRQAEKLTGWKHEDAIGRPFDEIFNIINEETRLKVESPIKRVIQSGIIIGLANHTTLISRFDKEYSIADSAAPIKDSNGKILGVVIVFRNVTEEKKRQKQVQYISYHDALTGLYNRRYCEEQFSAIDTMDNIPISVIMGDLNGLKVTNDAFGHSQGDQLIQKAADAMQAACRANDIVARWGGDEFVILLPKASSSDAERIIKRIVKIESDMKVGLMNVSVSFGYGTKKAEGENILTALKNAEDNMYEKKVVESENTRGKLIDAAISTLCKNSLYEINHYKRVGDFAQKIGATMHLTDVDDTNLKRIGQLHDIGKIAVNNSILLKKGPLTKVEMDEIRRHPDVGYKILKSSKGTADIAEYVLYHHERYDGKGYPTGLKGENIPLLSRIITVADAFDAMTNDRSYRKALSIKAAINELIANKGTQFDPTIVDVAIKMLKVQ